MKNKSGIFLKKLAVITASCIAVGMFSACGAKAQSSASSGAQSAESLQVVSSSEMEAASVVNNDAALAEKRQLPDYRVQQVYLMLKAYIEKDEYSPEEIFAVATPEEEFVQNEYDPAELIQNETNNGVVKAGYQTATDTYAWINYPTSALDVLDMISEYVSEDNDSKDNAKIALELTEYYLTIRQYQNIENAIEPYEYNGTTYDLSVDASLRALMMDVSLNLITNDIAPEGSIRAIAAYREKTLGKEELFVYLDDPELANENLIIYKDAFSENVEGKYKLYETKNSSKEPFLYGLYPFTTEWGTVTSVAVVGIYEPTYVLIDEDNAFKCVEELAKYADSYRFICMVACFDLRTPLDSVVRRELGDESDTSYKLSLEKTAFVLEHGMELDINFSLDEEFIQAELAK